MSSATEKPKEEKEWKHVTVELPAAPAAIGTKEIEKLPETKPKEEIKPTLNEREEDTRGRVALIFIIGFFVILIIAAVISAFSEGNKSDNLKDSLLTVSGILSIPLGFVIGYYFRKQEEE